jgi:hypothetical protein
MVSSTKIDRTEKLGITLPISLLRQIENKRGDIPPAHSLEERLKIT